MGHRELHRFDLLRAQELVSSLGEEEQRELLPCNEELAALRQQYEGLLSET